LNGFREIFGMTFIVNRQLFAGVNAVVRIGGDFQPDFRRASMITAALGHLRKLAARPWPDLRWQTNRQSLRACGMRALVLAAPLQKSGKSEKIKALEFVCAVSCLT